MNFTVVYPTTTSLSDISGDFSIVYPRFAIKVTQQPQIVIANASNGLNITFTITNGNTSQPLSPSDQVIPDFELGFSLLKKFKIT